MPPRLESGRTSRRPLAANYEPPQAENTQLPSAKVGEEKGIEPYRALGRVRLVGPLGGLDGFQWGAAPHDFSFPTPPTKSPVPAPLKPARHCNRKGRLLIFGPV